MFRIFLSRRGREEDGNQRGAGGPGVRELRRAARRRQPEQQLHQLERDGGRGETKACSTQVVTVLF